MPQQKIHKPYLDGQITNGQERITVVKNSIILDYPCPQSTQCGPYILTLEPGRYQFEVWGAQGGGKNTGIKGVQSGGKGGYSRGKFLLSDETTFYIYIGSSGINGGNGGHNGGGAIGSSDWVNADNNNNRAPGGGATDIRLIKGSLQSISSIDYTTTFYGPNESLLSRVIVAGGGGGMNEEEGYGGGLEGSNDYHYLNEVATSGSQIHPGKTHAGIDAGFGYGGYTKYRGQGISGGGGGWYGGGGATYGLGGSGYVSKSLFYIYETIQGNEPFPGPLSGNERGHSGDGVAKITYLNIFYDCTKANLIQPRLLLISCFLFTTQ